MLQHTHTYTNIHKYTTKIEKQVYVKENGSSTVEKKFTVNSLI